MGQVWNSTHRLSPYEVCPIATGGTIALVTGDVPKVYVRDGTDVITLWEGQSLVFDGPGVQLINPYPFGITVQLTYGLPVQLATTVQTGVSSRHFQAVTRYVSRRDAVAAGFHQAIGLMMARGRAEVEFFHEPAALDSNTQMMCFRNARPDFLALKPGGIMTATPVIRDGRFDQRGGEALLSVAGRYTDADVTAWETAAGYDPTWKIVNYHRRETHGLARFYIDTETALFFIAKDGYPLDLMARITLLGADPEEWS